MRAMASAASDWLKEDKRRLLHAVYRVGDMQVCASTLGAPPHATGTGPKDQCCHHKRTHVCAEVWYCIHDAPASFRLVQIC